jgi:pyridoxamine 5'-phosphate oxidase
MDDTAAPPGLSPPHAALLDQAFAMLAHAAADARAPARNLVVGTSGDGIRLRIMVLRAFLPNQATPHQPAIELHTDARSPKLNALRACPRISALAWDPAMRVQITVQGAASLLDPAATAAIWRALPTSTRGTYAVGAPPGTPIADPAEPASRLDEAHAASMFRVLRVGLDELEWLHLAADRHQRARFTWANGAVQATWLMP